MEQISDDCFNNPFKTDTGTPAKNIPSLDEIDNKGTVSTCRSLIYFSSSPYNSEISTITDITVSTAPTADIGHTDLNEVQLEGGRYNGAASCY